MAVLPGIMIGYYFYLSAFEDYPGYGCSGHGGQAVFVNPDKRLVLVITAWPYTDSAYTDGPNDLFSLIYDSCH